MHKNVCSSNTRNSPNVETIQISINSRMDKLIVSGSHNGIAHKTSNKRSQELKEHMLYDSRDMKLKTGETNLWQ